MTMTRRGHGKAIGAIARDGYRVVARAYPRDALTIGRACLAEATVIIGFTDGRWHRATLSVVAEQSKVARALGPVCIDKDVVDFTSR